MCGEVGRRGRGSGYGAWAGIPTLVRIGQRESTVDVFGTEISRLVLCPFTPPLAGCRGDSM